MTSAPFLFPLAPFPNPLEALPAALNHLLGAEPWAREQLRVHARKTFKVALPPFSLALTVRDDGSVRLADPDAAVNVEVELPLAAVGRVLAQGPRAVLGDVSLQGDAEFAQTISRLAQDLRWEYEEDLSRVVGDVAAARLVAGGRAALKGGRQAAHRLVDNVTEYFLEEEPQLVRARHVTELGEAIRVLRDDLERLGKRIDRLERAH